MTLETPLLFESLPLDAGSKQLALDESMERVAIRFTVPGTPIPKGRARTFVRGGFVQFYTPPETTRYEQKIKKAARDAIGDADPIHLRPLALMLRVFLPIPQSWSDKKKASALREEILPTGRPDADNFLKIACDGMNGIVFKDDALITDMYVTKRYSAEPRMEIELFV
jgi:Holliday junction resolvase RusA-like endonuclease